MPLSSLCFNAQCQLSKTGCKCSSRSGWGWGWGIPRIRMHRDLCRTTWLLPCVLDASTTCAPYRPAVSPVFIYLVVAAAVLLRYLCWPFCSKDFIEKVLVFTTVAKAAEKNQNRTSPRMKDQLFFSACCSACPPSTTSQVETAALSCKKKQKWSVPGVWITQVSFIYMCRYLEAQVFDHTAKLFIQLPSHRNAIVTTAQKL